MAKVTRREFLAATGAAFVGSTVLQAQTGTAVSPFFRAPYIQNLRPDEVTVLWALNRPMDASLVIGDAAGRAVWASATASTFEPSVTGLNQTYYQYRATIRGLAPGSAYAYKIWADGAWLTNPLSSKLEFRTPAAGPFQFLCFADSGDGGPNQIQLAKQLLAENPALVLANGDLAYDLATYESIETNYHGVYKELMARVPFFATLGNHEYYTGTAQPSLAGRVHPTDGVPVKDQGRYYSFDWDNVHFVALDSNVPLAEAAAGTGEMISWLRNDLAKTRKFWRVVFFHHPAYATGKHENEPEVANIRQYVVPILEEFGVQLVFNGHEHNYQRTYELRRGNVVEPNSGGIVYVTSGGGGAQTYWSTPNARIAQSLGMNHYVRAGVDSAKISLQVRGMSLDSDIDSLELRPAPQITAVVDASTQSTNFIGGATLSISGRNLCPAEISATVQEARIDAAGCSVTLNDTPLILTYADGLRINAQIPASFAGSGRLVVRTPNGQSERSIQVSQGSGYVQPKASSNNIIRNSFNGGWGL